MNSTRDNFLLHPSPSWRRDALLVLAALALFLPGIGARDLWNPDEPRYALIAHEMVESGQWLFPHLNGEMYTQKPPLFFWLVAIAGLLVGGVDAVAARLPSVLAVAAAVPAVFRLGARSFGSTAGWLAAAIFATSARILWQGRIGQIDMLLIASVAWSMWFWRRGLEEDRRDLAWAGYAIAGLGTIAKGPVSLLPPLLGLIVWWLWEQRSGSRRRAFARLHLGSGMALWAAVVLLWLGPALWAGGGAYFDQLVLRQTVTRFADPWHHLQPWYYLWTSAPAEFLPWSLLLPAALLATRMPAISDAERSGIRFAACWALGTLVFFSLSPGKRSIYVLTMFPALAILVAQGVRRLDNARSPSRARRMALVIPLAVMSLASAILVAALGVRYELVAELARLEPAIRLLTLSLILLFAIGSGVATVLAWRQRAVAATAVLAATLALFGAAASTLVLPAFDPVKSPRYLAEEFRARAGGDPYTIWPRFDANIRFYVGRSATVVHGEEELIRFLERPGPAWIFMKSRNRNVLAGAPFEFEEVARDPDERDGIVLLRRR